MKVCVLTQHFPPESAAGGLRFHQMAKRWAKREHEVHIYTCHPTSDKNSAVPYEEEMDGIHIHRIKSAQEKGSFIQKLRGQLEFSVKAPKKIRACDGWDLLIVTSPPFFCLIAGARLAKKIKIPFIADIRDLYPQSAIELGVLKNKALIRIFEWFEIRAYKSAAHVVAVTETIRKHIERKGISANSLLTNGIDPDDVKRVPYDSKLAEALGAKGKFVVSYIGTHGMSQALDKVVEAAALLKDRDDIAFLMVGAGAMLDSLREQAAGLPNIQFLGLQPHEDMPRYYSIIDVGIISLRNIALFEGAIPSKTFELMACGVPVIASLSGECAEILNKSKAAVIVPPEDPDKLAEAIVSLAESFDKLKEMAENGPDFALSNFGRDRLAADYLKIMNDIIERKKA